MESKKLTNHESNRSASDISNHGNHNSVNSDSGRWSTSDSEEGVSIPTKTNPHDATNEKRLDAKKASYFKLNLMNSLKKAKETNKIKAKSKSDQNLVDDYKDEKMSSTNRNDENVRNEDIFIYVPTIREKTSSKLNSQVMVGQLAVSQVKTNSRIFETNNRTSKSNKTASVLNRFNSMNCSLQDWSAKMNKTNQELSKKLNEKDELNKSQSNISSNSSTSSQKSNKPQIVSVYPKRSNSIGELLNSDQSKPNSDDDRKDEEIKKLYCLRKQIAKSSITLKGEMQSTKQLLTNKSYKSNLQNSIDTLSTNNSGNLSEDDNNIEDYEELIASTLQQKRVVKKESETAANGKTANSLRGSKLYASFTNDHTANDKFSCKEFSSSSLFRTGQYYNQTGNNQVNYKSTSNLSNGNLSNCNLSNSSSQNALVNGEFYLMKGTTQSSFNSLNLINNNELDKYESLEPSIYGKHLNTLSKDKYKKPQTELEINQTKQGSYTLQHSKKERNSTGKKIASQLQSYFFSGSISNKKKNENKNDDSKSIKSSSSSNLKKQINDLSDKFPLPNAYKKNFILKGHLNCGLYSTNLTQDEQLNSLNPELLNYKTDDSSIKPEQPNGLSIHEIQTKKSKSFKNKSKITKNDIELVQNSCINLGLNSLGLSSSPGSGLANSVSDVHREIAIAAKELGAWY